MTTTRPTLRELFELGREQGRTSALATYEPWRDDRHQTVAELLAETREIIATADRRRWAGAHGVTTDQAPDLGQLAEVVSLADRRQVKR